MTSVKVMKKGFSSMRELTSLVAVTTALELAVAGVTSAGTLAVGVA